MRVLIKTTVFEIQGSTRLRRLRFGQVPRSARAQERSSDTLSYILTAVTSFGELVVMIEI